MLLTWVLSVREQIRAALLIDNKTSEIEDVECSESVPGELMIKTSEAGVCHLDFTMIQILLT